MNLDQKLLAMLFITCSITAFSLKPNQVLSQPLNHREIRDLAKSITVKIVDHDTLTNGSGVIFNHKKLSGRNIKDYL